MRFDLVDLGFGRDAGSGGTRGEKVRLWTYLIGLLIDGMRRLVQGRRPARVKWMAQRK